MDKAALDAAYDNRAAVRDYPGIAAARTAESERYRAATTFHADLRYGPGARERLGAPRVPVDRVPRVLEEIGARLARQPVRHAPIVPLGRSVPCPR